MQHASFSRLSFAIRFHLFPAWKNPVVRKSGFRCAQSGARIGPERIAAAKAGAIEAHAVEKRSTVENGLYRTRQALSNGVRRWPNSAVSVQLWYLADLILLHTRTHSVGDADNVVTLMDQARICLKRLEEAEHLDRAEAIALTGRAGHLRPTLPTGPGIRREDLLHVLVGGFR